MHLHRIFNWIIVLITILGLFITYSFCKSPTFPIKAFCVVPVADLLGSAQKKLSSYASIPVCGELNAHLSCNRVHQLLYNEQVTIEEHKHKQYRISIPSVYYVTADAPTTAHTTYWVKDDALVTFDTLKKNGLSPDYIPAPLDFMHSHQPTQTIITLALPYHDPITNLTFSAGTRFVAASTPDLPSNRNSVVVFDPGKSAYQKISLPKSLCIVANATTPPATRIKNFVQLLKTWATFNTGFIPYVWGGSSFTTLYTEPFFERTTTWYGIPTSWYEFDKPETTQPKAGFDCTTLVARAAQMCEIPYHFKNSFTLEKYMLPLSPTEDLAEGDLIKIPGHVMVVASLAHNTLFEARGYLHGYGKIQEIPLDQVFKDMHTYQDLVTAYRTHQTIYRLDINGAVRDTINQVKLYTDGKGLATIISL